MRAQFILCTFMMCLIVSPTAFTDAGDVHNDTQAIIAVKASRERLIRDIHEPIHKADTALINKVYERGRLPVIVRLREHAQSCGIFSDRARPRRKSIGILQSRVLDDIFAHTAHDENQLQVKRFSVLPAMGLQVDARALEVLMAHPNVFNIIEDVLFSPLLQDSVELIGSGPGGTFNGYTGQGQVIAVLDDGVDAHHPFLAGTIVSEACYSSNVPEDIATSLCHDGVTESTKPGSGMPCDLDKISCDHGTHVAGIAAGRARTFSGVAQDASIIAIQVFSLIECVDKCDGYPPCKRAYSSDILRGLERVYELSTTFPIAAVNMSLGRGEYASPCNDLPHKQVIDLLRSAGTATVAASGNTAFTNALAAPACISSVISVGNTTKADTVAPRSNSADFLSLLAPGTGITSSVPGNTYIEATGTSMAAPHVAGAWAVLRQARPHANVGEILYALQATGMPVTDTRTGAKNRDTARIQVQDALAHLLSPHLWIGWDDGTKAGAAGLAGGGTLTVASRWKPGDLPESKKITRIRVGIHEAPSEAHVLIWQGHDRTMDLHYSQAFSPVAYTLNEIMLDEPYIIDHNHEVFFGWSAVHAAGEYPCALDRQTRPNLKGNLILHGQAWKNLSDVNRIAGDWLIQAYCEHMHCVTDADCPEGYECAGLECVWVKAPEPEPDPEPCIAAYLLGEHDPRLDILRRFRDEKLAAASTGMHLIALYYDKSAALIELCEKYPILKQHTAQMLKNTIEVIGTLKQPQR